MSLLEILKEKWQSIFGIKNSHIIDRKYIHSPNISTNDEIKTGDNDGARYVVGIHGVALYLNDDIDHSSSTYDSDSGQCSHSDSGSGFGSCDGGSWD